MQSARIIFLNRVIANQLETLDFFSIPNPLRFFILFIFLAYHGVLGCAHTGQMYKHITAASTAMGRSMWSNILHWHMIRLSIAALHKHSNAPFPSSIVTDFYPWIISMFSRPRGDQFHPNARNVGVLQVKSVRLWSRCACILRLES